MDWSRAVYFLAGWVFVGVATVGAFLPLLPTTPFLLLASSCFIRSSPRAQAWLLRSRWFGPMLREWDERRAVRRPVKVAGAVVVLGAMGLALMREVHWGVRVAIIGTGLVGLGVLWWLPTAPAPVRGPSPEQSQTPEEPSPRPSPLSTKERENGVGHENAIALGSSREKI